MSREKLLPGFSGDGGLTVGATYWRFCGTGIGATEVDTVLGVLPMMELLPQLENSAATEIVARILHRVNFMSSI